MTLADACLALLVLVVATWTIVVRGIYPAVIGFIAYGVVLALIWVRLASIDVALTETAVGSGVSGTLLLRAAARHTGPTRVAAPAGLAFKIGAALLSAAVSAALGLAILAPPDPAPSLASAAIVSLPHLGLGNPVTAVLVAYRAFDTWLEAVVLLLALVAIWSLTRGPSWTGTPTIWGKATSSPPLTLLAQLLAPAGTMVGIYMLWVGADAPGGAFQGGAILAAMWLLPMMARLVKPPPIENRWLLRALIAGPAIFLAIGLAGFATADAFLAYPAFYGKPLIILIEAALTLSIAATLTMMVAGPPQTAEAP
jgi:multisubunit Na+/H+ antiporter MnhB subunit